MKITEEDMEVNVMRCDEMRALHSLESRFESKACAIVCRRSTRAEWH